LTLSTFANVEDDAIGVDVDKAVDVPEAVRLARVVDKDFFLLLKINHFKEVLK